MKIRKFAAMAVLSAGSSLAFAHSAAYGAKETESKYYIKTVANESNAFGLDLYSKLSAQNKGNLFFSPASIDAALAMTYSGAAGNTADQMAKTMHLSMQPAQLAQNYGMIIDQLNHPPKAELVTPDGKSTEQPAYQLVMANALWGQHGYAFNKAFTQELDESYHAGLNQVDFSQSDIARNTINDWVAKTTHDKIKDLIPEGALTKATRLVLTNAIYFKSNWADKFQKSATSDADFHVDADKQVKASMMHMTHRFHYAENDTMQMVVLPYTSGELSMVILLPQKADGMADLEKNLTADHLKEWTSKTGIALIDLRLPKFTFSSSFDLGDTLAGMGMTDAFDRNLADFSKMTTADKLYISKVVHKAFIGVDEEGTEAAAATAVIMRMGMAMRPEQPTLFNADHPFVFMIVHNTSGQILFLGRVVDPTAK